MTFPLNEMYGYSRLCDRLRSSAIMWKQVSLRSSAIVCDHMETSLKGEFRNCEIEVLIESFVFRIFTLACQTPAKMLF